MLKTHWTWRIRAIAYIELSLLHYSILGTGRYFAHYQWRNINVKPATNPLIFNGVLPVRHTTAIVAQTCGSNQLISDLTLDPFHEMEPTPDIALVTKNMRLDNPWTSGKTKSY